MDYLIAAVIFYIGMMFGLLLTGILNAARWNWKEGE